MMSRSNSLPGRFLTLQKSQFRLQVSVGTNCKVMGYKGATSRLRNSFVKDDEYCNSVIVASILCSQSPLIPVDADPPFLKEELQALALCLCPLWMRGFVLQGITSGAPFQMVGFD